jgi:hypothetical protein
MVNGTSNMGEANHQMIVWKFMWESWKGVLVEGLVIVWKSENNLIKMGVKKNVLCC